MCCVQKLLTKISTIMKMKSYKKVCHWIVLMRSPWDREIIVLVDSPQREMAVMQTLAHCNSLLLVLIHQCWVMHICISKPGHHWFREWLVACLAPSHYPIQCWILWIGHLGTNFSEILIKIIFSFKKTYVKTFMWKPCLQNSDYSASYSTCQHFWLNCRLATEIQIITVILNSVAINYRYRRYKSI